MRVLVIGATGHIGSYLVRSLISLGNEVFAVSRGGKKPYVYDADIWKQVQVFNYSREEFLKTDILKTHKFDAVCDLISYSVEQVKALTDKLTYDQFYLQIGSIWTYENKIYLPVDENHPHNAAEDYGKNKGKIEEYLMGLSRNKSLRCCVIHPGHISGKGWMPINPQGNLNVDVFNRIRQGKQVVLPFWGLATLQHVHSQDLSDMICACLNQQEVSNGEAFISTAEKAMTMRAICEQLYAHFGHKPALKYVSWEEFVNIVGEQDAAVSQDHIAHSPCCTCDKSRRLLGVSPKKTIMDIYYEYLDN